MNPSSGMQPHLEVFLQTSHGRGVLWFTSNSTKLQELSPMSIFKHPDKTPNRAILSKSAPWPWGPLLCVDWTKHQGPHHCFPRPRHQTWAQMCTSGDGMRSDTPGNSVSLPLKWVVIVIFSPEWGSSHSTSVLSGGPGALHICHHKDIPRLASGSKKTSRDTCGKWENGTADNEKINGAKTAGNPG